MQQAYRLDKSLSGHGGRLPLFFLTGQRFKRKLDEYLRSRLRKGHSACLQLLFKLLLLMASGVPSLFRTMRSYYFTCVPQSQNTSCYAWPGVRQHVVARPGKPELQTRHVCSRGHVTRSGQSRAQRGVAQDRRAAAAVRALLER